MGGPWPNPLISPAGRVPSPSCASGAIGPSWWKEATARAQDVLFQDSLPLQVIGVKAFEGPTRKLKN